MLLHRHRATTYIKQQHALHRSSPSQAGHQCALSRVPLHCNPRLTGLVRRNRPTSAARQQPPELTEYRAFETLKALAPVCAADLATPASGVRGLVATSTLREGQTVLFVPDINSISVPTGGSTAVVHWHTDFLQPWQQQHGALPTALIDFLADTRFDSTTRLAAWLLYLKQYSSSTGSSKPLWDSWLALLPSTDEATNACGLWTTAELQQLQLEPYKGVMSKINSMTADVCKEAYNHLQTGELGLLNLAESVDDVMWGAFVTRTRATSIEDAVTLRPMHDMLNHAEQPNASCYLTDEGYAIEALTNIPPGTEITISYTGDEPLGSDLNLGTPSLELLMTWGFTLGPGESDLILPMQYQALPGFDWQTVVAAAAATLQKQQQEGVDGGLPASSDDQMLNMLQAAVANTPVVQANASSSSGSSSMNSALYKRAADVIQKFGMLGSSCCSDSTAAAAAASTGTPGVMRLVSNILPGAAMAAQLPVGGSSSSSRISSLDAAVQNMPEYKVYERPYLTQLHLRKMQSQFVTEVTNRLPPLQKMLLTANAQNLGSHPAAATAAASLLQVPLAFVQWVNNAVLDSFDSSSSSSSSGDRVYANTTAVDPNPGNWGTNEGSWRQQQMLVAKALWCEAQYMLLQCDTTLEQDQAVMQYLQGYKGPEAGFSKDMEFGGSDEVMTAVNDTGLRLAWQQQQQQQGGKQSFVAYSSSRVISISGRSFAAAAAASSLGVAVKHPMQQIKLANAQIFKQRQLQVTRQLMLLHADATLEAALPRSQAAAVIAAAANNSKQQQRGGFAGGTWSNARAVAVVASTAGLAGLQFSNANALGDMPAAAAAAAAAAPIKLITALGSSSSMVCAFELGDHNARSMHAVAAALAQQEQQITAWQQQQQQQGRYNAPPNARSSAAAAAACEAAIAEAAELLTSGQVCKNRLMTAVAARMQHKQLLLTYSNMLSHMQQQLQGKHAELGSV